MGYKNDVFLYLWIVLIIYAMLYTFYKKYLKK